MSSRGNNAITGRNSAREARQSDRDEDDYPHQPTSSLCVQQSVVGREAFEALDRSELEGAWPHSPEAELAWTNLDLHPGDALRITVERDPSGGNGELGRANAIPVASPSVRWNAGGWIDVRVAQVDLGSRRATLLVEMGEIDSGHAGPNAFHTTKDVVRTQPACLDGDALWFCVASRDNRMEAIAVVVFARWACRKPSVPLSLSPGERVELTFRRDESREGTANAVPVLYPTVKWNAGGWIHAVISTVSPHVVTADVVDGVCDYGHAGPAAHHSPRAVHRGVQMRITGDSLLFAVHIGEGAEAKPYEISIVDRWTMARQQPTAVALVAHPGAAAHDAGLAICAPTHQHSGESATVDTHAADRASLRRD